ncbi:hypothetical protein GJV26_21625 [Massilia dura]|uniref:Uncharacterized protein n=1 Tax=Pseudoduganella dura TaxID=321982 RepID=A0A6I3XKR5_9BURK|nr:hypothetical protein [Pseudoduganella dura]
MSVSAKEPKPSVLPEQQVKKQIIEESIAAYPGRCPCPYNSARNGSSCGGRSAWSKKGGYAPICYEKEVTKEMVRQWRAEKMQASTLHNP